MGWQWKILWNCVAHWYDFSKSYVSHVSGTITYYLEIKQWKLNNTNNIQSVFCINYILTFISSILYGYQLVPSATEVNNSD